jgi:hypothetical protein
MDHNEKGHREMIPVASFIAICKLNYIESGMDKIAVAGLAVGVVSAAAAIVAAVFAGKSPTKRDLERVESHMARVDGHLSEQNERDLLTNRAGRVSITVRGHCRMSDPLTLALTVKDPEVTLLRLELINSSGMLTGEAPCMPSEPLSFSSTLTPSVTQLWFNNGTTHLSVDQRLMLIRAIMEIGKRETQRIFTVVMYQGTQQTSVPGTIEQFFGVSGTC